MEIAASLPLMDQFMVSAPGKVILFGDYAVMYGRQAIGAAISLRSYLLVKTLSESERIITIDFKEINLRYTWFIDDLPWPCSIGAFKNPPFRYTRDKTLLAAIKPLVERISPHLPQSQQRTHHTAATVFLYLLMSQGTPKIPGSVFILRSTIPVGAGLGSSASFCVCLSAALLIQTKGLGGLQTTREEQLVRINNLAYIGELCIHGYPSGIDNAITCQGGGLLFKTNGKRAFTNTLRHFPLQSLLIINTQQSRRTAEQIQKVQARTAEFPFVVNSVLEAMDSVTREALDLLFSASAHLDGVRTKHNAVERLGTLISISHGLLLSLGASHPGLEHISEIAEKLRIGWTKLTGAGGGGCAIVLPRPDIAKDALSALDVAITMLRFEKYEVVLGSPGVAVRGRTANGSMPAEVCQVIDEERFTDVDAYAIEQLIGLDGKGKGGQWTYWGRSL